MRPFLVLQHCIFALFGVAICGALPPSHSLTIRDIPSDPWPGAHGHENISPKAPAEPTATPSHISKPPPRLQRRTRDGLERERAQSERLEELTREREARLRYERFIDRSPRSVAGLTRARDEWIKAEIRRALPLLPFPPAPHHIRREHETSSHEQTREKLMPALTGHRTLRQGRPAVEQRRGAQAAEHEGAERGGGQAPRERSVERVAADAARMEHVPRAGAGAARRGAGVVADAVGRVAGAA